MNKKAGILMAMIAFLIMTGCAGAEKNTDTTGLKEAVENNPEVEGWGNKIVSISPFEQ